MYISHLSSDRIAILFLWLSLKLTKRIDKRDNFAFKNSNIIIEGIIWKRKYYFQRMKFETYKNNLINKYIFSPTFFLIA